MTQTTIRTRISILARISAWVRRHQHELSARIHAAGDERARQHGWTVTATPGRFGLEAVPVLYQGPFSWSVVEEHTYGPTTLCPPEAAGRFGGREGCVITPVTERYDADLGGTGRVILKSISADYLARKGGTDER